MKNNFFRYVYLLLIQIGCGVESQKNPSEQPLEIEEAEGKVEKTRVSFVYPIRDIETNQDVEISVKFSGSTKNTQWNLFFQDAEKKDSEPSIIAQNIKAQDSKVVWNTAAIDPGTYLLIASYTSPSAKGRVQNKAKVRILEKVKPIVSLISSLEEKVISSKSPYEIKFSGADAEALPLTYMIELSSNAGKTWTSIAKDLSQPVFLWDVSKYAQGTQYKLRITATNTRGGIGVAEMSKTFGIVSEPVTFASEFGKLLSEKCASCHAGGSTNSDKFRCDSYALADIGVSAKADAIKMHVEKNTMPPNVPLSTKEKDIVTLWHWSGGN